MNISAVIIAKDEEKNIKECLESLTWVSEIVLVDSGSKDGTCRIADKYKCRIIETDDDNFSHKRNIGAKEARGEWILYIDVDERVTPLLRKEILSVVGDRSRALSRYSAWAIPRRNFILGKELKHGGWWPDYVKRLFLKRNLESWSGELHEEPHFDGNMGHLKNPLIHLKHDNLEEMVDKTNNWSEIEAKLMFEAGHPPMNILRFMTAMFREAWLRMVKHAAFLDGSVGIIYALYQVYSRFISYAKLWEMQVNKKIING